jgi:hypothetical protein
MGSDVVLILQMCCYRLRSAGICDRHERVSSLDYRNMT